MSFNLNKVSHKDEDVTVIEFEDGSNLTIQKKPYDKNLVEISLYTSNVMGYYREYPVVHMVNSNTLMFEIRKKKITNELIKKTEDNVPTEEVMVEN